METLIQRKPDMSKVPGGWEPNTDLQLNESHCLMTNRFLLGEKEHALVYDNFLSKKDVEKLKHLFLSSHIAAPVSIQGRQDVPDDRVGSVRATGWSEHLADQLWKRLSQSKVATQIRTIENEFVATDWWQNGKKTQWKPIGISPMLRFMKYEQGGQHYAHYDAGFIYPNPEYRTLSSIVIYLTTNEGSGATRFIEDNQRNIPVWDRNHEDWIRETKTEEVLASSYPKEGSVLVFDHRICHDVEQFNGPGDRIIIRGDIIYQAI